MIFTAVEIIPMIPVTVCQCTLTALLLLSPAVTQVTTRSSTEFRVQESRFTSQGSELAQCTNHMFALSSRKACLE